MGAFFILVGTFSCEKNEAPIPMFEVSPTRGHYSQEFSFDASASNDLVSRDYELEVRWDFNGDGIWDSEWSVKKKSTYYFPERGIYISLLQIRDPKGKIAETKRQVDVSTLNLKSLLIDPRDFIEYKTVLIDSIWWMAQDLHHGKWLSMWEKAFQTDNGIVERYGLSDFEDLDVNSGYYNYGEAMDYRYNLKTQGICPPGWYIPSNEEWISLVEHIGEDKDPAIFLSVLGDEGVNLGYGGRRYIGWGGGLYDSSLSLYWSSLGLYWSSSGLFDREPYTFNIFFFPKDTSFLQPITFEPHDSMHILYYEKYAIPLRCVKPNER